jgi:hypothetical protein
VAAKVGRKQVVAQRDDEKLGPRGGRAPQWDPSQPSHFDLAEDRLDDRFPHLIGRLRFDTRQLVPHPLRCRCCWSRRARVGNGAVFWATRRDQQFRPLESGVLDGFAAEVAGVGGRRLRQLAQVFHNRTRPRPPESQFSPHFARAVGCVVRLKRYTHGRDFPKDPSIRRHTDHSCTRGLLGGRVRPRRYSSRLRHPLRAR